MTARSELPIGSRRMLRAFGHCLCERRPRGLKFCRGFHRPMGAGLPIRSMIRNAKASIRIPASGLPTRAVPRSFPAQHFELSK